MKEEKNGEIFSNFELIDTKEDIKVCMDISGDINNDQKRSTRVGSVKD